MKQPKGCNICRHATSSARDGDPEPKPLVLLTFRADGTRHMGGPIIPPPSGFFTDSVSGQAGISEQFR
jgi:hypothetical protein